MCGLDDPCLGWHKAYDLLHSKRCGSIQMKGLTYPLFSRLQLTWTRPVCLPHTWIPYARPSFNLLLLIHIPHLHTSWGLCLCSTLFRSPLISTAPKSGFSFILFIRVFESRCSPAFLSLALIHSSISTIHKLLCPLSPKIMKLYYVSENDSCSSSQGLGAFFGSHFIPASALAKVQYGSKVTLKQFLMLH